MTARSCNTPLLGYTTTAGTGSSWLVLGPVEGKGNAYWILTGWYRMLLPGATMKVGIFLGFVFSCSLRDGVSCIGSMSEWNFVESLIGYL